MKSKAEYFHFCGYEIDSKNKEISFKYKIEFSNKGPLEFIDKVILPEATEKIREEKFKKFLEPLSIILGISYYKLYCPSRVKLSYKLSKEQAEFWNIVYRKGLGEFLYRNQLNFDQMAKFPYSEIEASPVSVDIKDKILLGIGGGKDSIVASELLKDFDVTSFLIETQRTDELSESVSEVIGNPILRIQRELDPKIFEKHEGSYNGHIPISAIFAFIGLLTSALYGYKYIVVANECSSNFGNIEHCGEVVNHQWSKSMEFESMLQEYTRKFITLDIAYFSVIRQFHEIRVAKIFSQYKKYFSVFSSCNKNVRIYKDRPETLWCGECPKCTFVFLMLAAFLSKKELLKIFGKNLFEEKSLISLFNDLLGFGSLKPFDCVGTFEESQAALFLSSKKFKDTLVVKTFLPKIKSPEKIVKKVFKTSYSPTLPAPFRFLGIDNICILGYGKEGKISEKYIKKNYPNLKIGILDQSLDENYLEKQKYYDLAIKTPGILRGKVNIPYVTATNIFFSQNKNFTIGVTGSKGKSTTTSLIYEILKEDGKKVRSIGNIGNPMLETTFSKVNPDEIFVIELSSYMLDDVEYSPKIAVLLNLFPEHLNYHIDAEKYYKAKRNIFKFQKFTDHAIEPPFANNYLVEKADFMLLGKHNKENIKAAIEVAKILKIDDSVIEKALNKFKPLPHRLELVGKFDDIYFYDDANAAIPEATIVAIETLEKVDTIFLGGEDRGYDFSELEKTLREYKVKNIVLFPDSGKCMLKLRKGFNILETKNMEEAVRFAYQNTEKEKICLLSMASPSYSLWKNFEEKGDLFQRLVKKYSDD
ncbi:MAG: hypothetical protein KAT32_01185 [Candidatus Moranbacteria bacterium]|nr:hypothetical protein [Candidatus Moranbacteria bacterium]